MSHMLFADDSYFYCKAKVEEARKVLELLAIYESESGQKVNVEKSSVFFSTNVITGNKSNICNELKMVEADGKSKYLGLPNILGRNKSSILGYLKNKVQERIRSWDNRVLVSKSGKEVLIKSAAQSLPVFAMSVFLLPVEITKDIERSLAKYWWKTSKNREKAIHWMSWDRLAKNKAVGGMGFRNFRDFNMAMLGKQGWRLATKPESLSFRVYKARYYADSNFMEAKLGNNPSFIWRSIWEAKQIVMGGSRWRLGTGESVRIIGQPWLMDEENPFITTESQSIVDEKVNSLMCNDRKEWDADIIRDIFDERDQECILNVKLDESCEEDTLYWSKEVTGNYTVKSAYNMIHDQKGFWRTMHQEKVWLKLWKIKAPPKILNHIWRALSSCLPTLVQLQQKHVEVPSTCPVCAGGEETILHALVTCPVAMQCWQIVIPEVGRGEVNNFGEWLSQIMEACSNVKLAEVAALCWAIWRARNEKVWNQKITSVNNSCYGKRIPYTMEICPG